MEILIFEYKLLLQRLSIERYFRVLLTNLFCHLPSISKTLMWV